MAILQWFRSGIKAQVIRKGPTSLDETVHAAKLAESVGVTDSDAVTEKLLDMMKASVQASENRATELQALSSKVARMS
jgi:hypothetical protein